MEEAVPEGEGVLGWRNKVRGRAGGVTCLKHEHSML